MEKVADFETRVPRVHGRERRWRPRRPSRATGLLESDTEEKLRARHHRVQGIGRLLAAVTAATRNGRARQIHGRSRSSPRDSEPHPVRPDAAKVTTRDGARRRLEDAPRAGSRASPRVPTPTRCAPCSRSSRGYAAGADPSALHPLLQQRPVKQRSAFIHITADRGLAGGLNANMNRAGAALVLEHQPRVEHVSIVAVGRKGRDFFRRAGFPIARRVHRARRLPGLRRRSGRSRASSWTTTSSGEIDQVFIGYQRFVNTAVQRPTVRQTPAGAPPPRARGEAASTSSSSRRPSSSSSTLLPRYVEMQIYEAVLEAAASEQSARMVAMRHATDAANEMVTDLTLAYNKARQELITGELLDIVGGAAALEQVRAPRGPRARKDPRKGTQLWELASSGRSSAPSWTSSSRRRPARDLQRRRDRRWTARPLIAEVQQHLGNNWVRCLALDSTDGLRRGADGDDTGAAISVPVGPTTLGRLFNVLGEPLDPGEAVGAEAALADPPRGPAVRRAGDQRPDARDRHQGHRPDRPPRPWW